MDFNEYLDFIGSNDPVAKPLQSPADAAMTAIISPIIGAALPRVDGPFKTTGTAEYAADYNLPGTVYAVPVCATIANGKIRSLDTSSAEKMPGVLLVLHHGNIGPLFRLPPGRGSGRASESRPPFEDEVIRYWGQYVALAVAQTLQQAQAAADAVKVTYDAQRPNVSTELMTDQLPAVGQPGGPRVRSHRGDPEGAFNSAAVKVDEVYVTPTETHNPMEMHATTAVYRNGRFTLYEASQGVMNHLTVMSQVLGVPKENIQVISRYIGSGFGGKLFPWPHSALCAAAARKLNRPVKLSVNRKMMFMTVGHRPRTEQRLRLATDAQGKLVSLRQDYRNPTSFTDEIGENCGEATPFLYSVANLQVTAATVRRNIGTPTPMRGPGAVPGLFALESAVDELCVKLKMDPVEFRIKHDTLIDEEKNKPFSSRHLKECLQIGAEKFGWAKRNPEVGSMRKGDLVLGWGVACASWGAGRGPSSAIATFRRDGTVHVSSGTQDPGTGTYTVVAQVITDKTGVPLDRVKVILGDSSLPPGPTSGGSTATVTVLPSVIDALESATKTLFMTATMTPGSPLEHKKAADLSLKQGRIVVKGESGPGVPFEEVLRAANVAGVNGEGKSGGLGSDTDASRYSTHSFGAQFVEVEYDPGIARVRVSRVVSVIDGGRIINKKTATNQIAGAVVMGVGMGLFEETIYDPRNGHPVNDSFADYLVATSADCPVIDVHFTDIPDPIMGSYGLRGIGEIGLAGVAPAITAAVYHATGVRVRELPVRIEDLLKSEVKI